MLVGMHARRNTTAGSKERTLSEKNTSGKETNAFRFIRYHHKAPSQAFRRLLRKDNVQYTAFSIFNALTPLVQ